MSSSNVAPTTDENEPLVLSESDIGSESDLTENESDTASEHDEKSSQSLGSERRDQPPILDPRFNQPAPSPFKRTALIFFTIFLFWVAFSMRRSLWEGKKAPKVIYASRYSKEHKFRPAASPIITETLKDGRIRIRGAGPTATPTPTPKTMKAKRKGKGRKAARKVARKSSTRK
ncbi:hypothetical protein BDZ94DRAFT_1267344 [Collybia nuda]|uniref:Uncharacterized protein n=1 Tax=Collybia nuda TaxID=64659 RepID=A0A9P5XZV4_9AGAR|nr:hypothetical protein BDZ94DRAFT_1267344 [Collybia nuda]